ncbi:MAG: UrcA family protein [Sphingobium sp.]|uniref:UrcA family protein n=1 Tax=Sphingobium sp. TaxID=1912891 RepID=UPI0029B8056D|nr:UrcA family protein [Sphingobium sp.]MDX3910353.1 UrcA family protein [Sphingobium sp.]
MRISTTSKGITAALVAAATLIAGAPAFAEPFVSNGRTAEVRYGDLDLSQPAGQAELKRRLNNAAFRVCALNPQDEMAACRKIALRHVSEPIKTAIARAETRSRYADATPTKAIAGN